MTRALIILPMGFEDIEAFTAIDLLNRANISLTIASLGYPVQVTSKSRVEVLTEGALEEFAGNSYELVILPGGPGHTNYFESAVLEKFLKAHKGLLAAICAAPRALARWGLLKSKRFTCFPGCREELAGALDEAVVVDGKLITSAGPGTAFAFALKLVELLEGAEVAAKIAAEACYSEQHI